MKSESTFIIHPSNNEQAMALKAFLKALKMSFEIKKEDKPYNPEFVKEILESRRQYENGEYTSMNMDELKAYLGAK
ncbi:MAG: DUF2683 family protein [Flavobacteriia bacterium]|jgi:hypothetical protein